ncbi:MAG: MotA/TolQ/ExbB proton channel family protein [Deltaproteobacteria bacterium]|nr:MotA/TolQ/ExbB proton channel family protein [bacterium]MCB9477774.1 MotA/TolQ/ExbB proton channel family protein [Deltaproteobacteria bacterium]MCB9488573.1 MotA/TolQ/ExbB proton channel family protein [Deltaproteobacteria bacterium]
MDIATLIGMVGTFGLVATAMLLGGSLAIFIDVPSVLITVLGTLMVVLVSYPLKDVAGLAKVVSKGFFNRDLAPDEYVDRLVKFGQLVRTEGILALEEAGKDVKDPFLKKGLMMAVDGSETEAIVSQMESEIEALADRHKKGADILQTAGTISPAMGMIGTLIGLVQMLQNMADPSAIGPAMAVALLTTFYGAMLANVVFNPLAGKLRTRSSSEVLYNTIIMVGVESISKGDNPRVIESRLNSLLPPNMRKSQFDK